MTYYQCRCTDVSGACESKTLIEALATIQNQTASMPIHPDPPGPRQPAGPARYTKDSSDDDFRDLRKIANLIDSYRVRLKHNPRSGVWLICVIRSQTPRTSFMSYFPSCPSKSHIPVKLKASRIESRL
jgi:hypothetical protein